MKIALLGASGCIGSVLTQYLLDNTQHDLVLFSHHAKRLQFEDKEEQRLTHVDGDVLQLDDIKKAVRGCDMVIYLIHLMGNAEVGRQFESAEQTAARHVVIALREAHISKLIYIGGAGNETTVPTRHLLSRNKTGEILREGIAEVIEYRTPMVIGKQAAGYEVIRNFVNNVPIIPVPTWGNASTQPITVTDVVRYIHAAINAPNTGHHIIDIGGPERLTYSEIFKRYAQSKPKRVYIFVTPLIPRWVVRCVFRLFKRSPAMITAADMIESSQHSYRVRTNMPTFAMHIQTEPIEKAFH